ncbi:MAG: PAS domain S-box protein [Candidatus Hydrogenedentes bacterium]|nr:PAS domain S-box protein [Candidatus Hydrogenedentota bacterium]
MPSNDSHKAEPENHQSWLHAVIETAVDAIITINERGIISYTNPAAQRMFGYTPDEMNGQNVHMLMPSPYREEHDEYIDHYHRTGERRIIGIGREVTARRKDGRVFPIHLSVSEVCIDNERIFTGIVRDITRDKEEAAEKDRLVRELREQNEKNTCLYGVGEAISSADKEMETIFQDVVRLIQPALHHPDRTRVRIVFDGACFESPDFVETGWRIAGEIVASGRRRGWLEVFYLQDPLRAPEEMFIEGEQSLVKAVADRLGESLERREAEAKVIQASKLASIGELAAGVSHEINNPINGIINCADILLQNKDLSESNRKFTQLIRSEADRIAVIVRNLLTFSRQEKEQHSLARMCDIVSAVLSLSSKRIAKSHIDLQVDVREDLPKLKCRSEQLQQVLMNLIINAIHALDERYPDMDPDKILSIRAHELSDREEPIIRLTVEDHGTGISPAHRDRLFDPFFTTKGRDRGTGLGLSVSDGIVKAHGGTITVESELGKYTRFHVDLPLNQTWTLREE